MERRPGDRKRKKRRMRGEEQRKMEDLGRK